MNFCVKNAEVGINYISIMDIIVSVKWISVKYEILLYLLYFYYRIAVLAEIKLLKKATGWVAFL